MDDFEFEGQWYRPEDLFRKKVLGLFPKVDEDTLIPVNGLKKRMNVGNKPKGVNRFGLTSIFSVLTWRAWGVTQRAMFFAVTTGWLPLTHTIQAAWQTT